MRVMASGNMHLVMFCCQSYSWLPTGSYQSPTCYNNTELGAALTFATIPLVENKTGYRASKFQGSHICRLSIEKRGVGGLLPGDRLINVPSVLPESPYLMSSLHAAAPPFMHTYRLVSPHIQTHCKELKSIQKALPSDRCIRESQHPA